MQFFSTDCIFQIYIHNFKKKQKKNSGMQIYGFIQINKLKK